MTQHAIGVVWDAYTPAVEGQLTRDLIAMQNQGPRVDLMVICPDNSADRLLKALGVTRGIAAAVAGLWITYQTGPEKVMPPEHADTVIERDLHMKVTDVQLDPDPHSGYYMKPQGRVVAPQLNLNKPPPSHNGVCDPMVIYLWGNVK